MVCKGWSLPLLIGFLPFITNMSTVTAIVREHRIAAARQRKEHRDPEKARAFLIRAGILSKSGKQLSRRYR